MVDELFQQDADGLEAGIHLHWALPDGLTHGLEVNGEILFPNVPTRWLVLRMAADLENPQQPKIRSKAWVIESDYLDQTEDLDQKRITIPTLDQPQPYRYLGKVFDYAEWGEGVGLENHLNGLKAIGPGDPVFAAYYPNCRNVFGVHDAEVCQWSKGQLTYLVVGWYSDPQSDPLYTCTSPETWMEKMQSLGWSVPDGTELFPNQTLCHGLIVNIPWQGVSADYPDGVPENELEVAVGNTYVEALSALLGSKFPSSQEMARLLEVVQYDLISAWAHPDGISEVEAKLHERTFASSLGETHWVIRKVQSKGKEIHFSQKVKDGLTELNRLQQEWERVGAEHDSLQWKAYSIWYRYISEASVSNGDKASAVELKRFEAEIEQLGAVIQLHQQKKKDFENKIRILTTDLQNLIAQELPGYELSQKASPRYWQAQNPVILMAGDQLQRSFKHGFDHRFDLSSNTTGQLACRVTGQTVRGLQIPWQGQDVVITGDDLVQWNPFTGGALVGVMEDLFIEAVLLSIDLAGMIAQLVCSKMSHVQRSHDRMEELVKTCQTVQLWHWNAYLHPDLQEMDERVMGVLPSKVGFELWSAPWTPLILEWEVQYFPTDSEITMEQILEHWRLEGLDFVWKGEEVPEALERYYQGSALLTPSAAVHLKNAMTNVVERVKSDDANYEHLMSMVERLGNLQVLAQGLSGFHRELIQQKEALQLAIFDPTLNPSLAAKLKEWVDGRHGYIPVPEATFHPIRAGFMKVIRLWIIDTFGRIQEVQCKTGDPIISAHLKTHGDQFDQLITLPPRLNQPARLSFQWLTAEGLMNDSAEPSTPICGWILPNYLDYNMMVYDHSGQFLGSLQRVFYSNERIQMQWLDPPGAVGDDSGVPVIEDPDLAAFINALLEYGDHSTHVLDELMSYFNYVLGGIDSQHSQKEKNLAVFMGRPLALIRASLRLELKGLPVERQGVGDFERTETLGFEKIAFPIHLGDATKLQDGVVGYFVHQGDRVSTYRKMYAVKGVSFEDSSYIQYGHELALTCDPEAEDTIITVLMDPGRRIHLRSGILPESAMELPEEEYKQIVSRLDFHFMVEPILSHPGRFSLPLPEVNNAKWQFIHQTSLQEWQIIDEIINADVEAHFVPGSKQIYEGWLKLTNRGT